MTTIVKTLVCFLEEPSAEEMLKVVFPRILSKDIYVRYVVFEGKQDLEKQIEKRIKFWGVPDSVFLVMRDQDSGDCTMIKQNLLDKVSAAGKLEKSLVRIACHELESFYLGDLQAVENGLKINGLAKQQQRQKYRDSDQLANASEELYKLTKNKYYKLSGSRAIAPYLKLDGSNHSYSFNVLLDGIRKLVGEAFLGAPLPEELLVGGER